MLSINKKPIANRIFVGLIGIALLSIPGVLSASEIAPLLTAQEAVRRGLSRPAVKQIIEGRMTVARSKVTQAGLWPNPQFHFQREAVSPGKGKVIDRYFWVSQEFDFLGRRELQIDAAKQRVQATQEEVESWRLGLIAGICRRFYQVLYQKKLQQVLEQWYERLEVIESVLRKREAGGVISGYDRLRLTREQAAVQARLQGEEAVYRRTWEQLLGVIGLGPGKTIYSGVTGALLPETPPPLKRLLQVLPRRPDLQRLQHRVEAATLERKAAARGWIPDITLNLGSRKTMTPVGNDLGSYVVVGISLPLFDRDQAKQDRAAAKVQIALSQYQLALRKAQGAVRGRWQALRRLIAIAREVRRQDVAAARELVRTAQTAYERGAIGILELLDAYQEKAEALIRALQLERRARQAHIKLERLTGGVL